MARGVPEPPGLKFSAKCDTIISTRPITVLRAMSIEHNTQLLFDAIERNNMDEVHRLIPVSDPKADNSWALELAAFKGNIECVKLLIPLCRPKANQSRALQWAMLNNNDPMIDLLYPVSSPKSAITALQTTYPHRKDIRDAMEARMQAHHLRGVLNKELHNQQIKKHKGNTQRKM